MRTLVGGLTIGLLFLATSGCSSDQGAKVEPARPLTLDEATRLASVQYDNYEDGGAEFEVNSAFVVSGDSLIMQGTVDWQHHVGHALVAGKGAVSGITEVYWTDNIVLERWPAADEMLTSLGYVGAQFFGRPPDPKTSLLDRALAVLFGLASTQRENAQLLQQTPGSSFLRTDELRGTAATVLRYGERNVYWLDAATDQLLRFEGNAEGGGAPIVVDFGLRTTEPVELPSEDAVVMIDRVPDLYEALQQGAMAPSGGG